MSSYLCLKRAIFELFLICICTQIPGQAHSKTEGSPEAAGFSLVLRFLPFSFCKQERKSTAVGDLACLHSAHILLPACSSEDIQVPSVM